MDYGAPTGGVSYYDDDGLGGLGGDDGLGGMGGSQPQPYAPYAPQPFDDPYGIGFGDDGLALEPVGNQQQEQQQQQQQQQQQDEGDGGGDNELDEMLDDALGLEPTQATGSQIDSSQRNQRTASDYDDEATEDEEVDMAGDGDTAGTAQAAQREATPVPEDPAAQEAQRQNAWFKECYDAMTEAQRNRLEAYTRSSLQKKTMKKVLQELTGTQLNDRIVLAISSITKMFVGELVETARLIAASEGHTGALLPSHIRQAYNAFSSDGRVPHRTCAKPLRLR